MTPHRRTVRGLERQRERLLLLMLLPAAMVIILLVAYPVVAMVDFAFRDIKLLALMNNDALPATLENFRNLFSDPKTADAFRVTVIFVFASTGLAFFWGLATALLLNRSFPGRTALRMLVVSPWAVAGVVASLSWMFLLNSETGLINYVLLSTGLSTRAVNFLGTYDWVLPTVVFVSAWKSYPFFTVMLLAGLKNVPRDALDAARIDGAGPTTSFFWVTVPALRPVVAVSLPLSLLASFREIETILVLTGGGPGRATETVAVAIYNKTFQFFEVGRASALGVVVFLLCLVLAIASLWVLQPKEPKS